MTMFADTLKPILCIVAFLSLSACGTSGPIVSHFGTETVAVDLVVRTYEINDYRKIGPTKHESYTSVLETARDACGTRGQEPVLSAYNEQGPYSLGVKYRFLFVCH